VNDTAVIVLTAKNDTDVILGLGNTQEQQANSAEGKNDQISHKNISGDNNLNHLMALCQRNG
jgi:hypothetical protein